MLMVILNFILLFVGFLPLIFGSNLLVDGSSSLAKKLKVPVLVIGMTVVAFGTSMPEMVVNIFAAIQGSSDIVIGNVIGSNLFNIMVVLGATALFMAIPVKRSTITVEFPLAILAVVLVLLLGNDRFVESRAFSEVSRGDGVILLLFFCLFLLYNYFLYKKGVSAEHIEIKEHKIIVSVIMIVLGSILLIAGGRMIVITGVFVARHIGISERIIGLTIISIGTSLPELTTSIVAAIKKNHDIAMGNIIGSNIFNIFFVLGLSSIISPVTIGNEANIDIILNAAVTMLILLFIFTNKQRAVKLWHALTLLAGYTGYILYLIIK